MNVIQADVQSLQINIPKSSEAVVTVSSPEEALKSDKFPRVFQNQISEIPPEEAQGIENKQLNLNVGTDDIAVAISLAVATPAEFWFDQLARVEVAFKRDIDPLNKPVADAVDLISELENSTIINTDQLPSATTASAIAMDGGVLPEGGNSLPVPVAVNGEILSAAMAGGVLPENGNSLPVSVAVNGEILSGGRSDANQKHGMQQNIPIASVPLPEVQEDLVQQNARSDKSELVAAARIPVSSLPELDSRSRSEKFSDSIIAKLHGPLNTHDSIVDASGARPQSNAAAMGGFSNLSSTSQPFSIDLTQLPIAKPENAAEWGKGLGDRVSWMINQKLNSATIRLDPPMLGKLEVSIQIRDDITSITINTQHAQTREMIENASFRLRDHLQEAGFQNVNVDVSNDQEQNQPGADHLANTAASEEGELNQQTDQDEEKHLSDNYSSDSLVDYFA